MSSEDKSVKFKSLKVCVSGAAGQIGYSLLFNLLRADVFNSTPLYLSLLELPQFLSSLKGVIMELTDTGSPLFSGYEIDSDPATGFKNADFIILVGSSPRQKGEERADLIKKNAKIFKEQGEIFKRVGKKGCKVLVVGNPANTNAAIFQHYSGIPSTDISAMSRLDGNRLVSQLRQICGGFCDIRDSFILGNHSGSMVCCMNHAVSVSKDGKNTVKPIDVPEDTEHDIAKIVKQRGTQILNARGKSSSASAAQAIVDHMEDWYNGVDHEVSVSIPAELDTEGWYTKHLTNKKVFFSMPCICKNGIWIPVKYDNIYEKYDEEIVFTGKELEQEYKTAMEFLESQN